MEVFLEVLAIAAEFAAWIALALILSFLVESLVEYFFGLVIGQIPPVKPYSELILKYIAAGAGIYLCFHYRLDLVYVLTAIASKIAGQPPVAALSGTGIVLTGLSVGRGASYVHDFIKKFVSKPQ